jgi:hypothetical protein
MTEDQALLRDMAAMFALTLMSGKLGAGINFKDIATECYEIADAMIDARNISDIAGLPAIKRRGKNDNKSNRVS